MVSAAQANTAVGGYICFNFYQLSQHILHLQANGSIAAAMNGNSEFDPAGKPSP
jgi:hypothetical protein